MFPFVKNYDRRLKTAWGTAFYSISGTSPQRMARLAKERERDAARLELKRSRHYEESRHKKSRYEDRYT